MARRTIAEAEAAIKGHEMEAAFFAETQRNEELRRRSNELLEKSFKTAAEKIKKTNDEMEKTLLEWEAEAAAAAAAEAAEAEAWRVDVDDLIRNVLAGDGGD